MNKAQAYNLFIEQGIYKLLGNNVSVPSVNGETIEKELKENNVENKWLFYIAPFVLEGFDLEKIYPTKAERKIIDWVKKLECQEPTNNTPMESVILRRILDV